MAKRTVLTIVAVLGLLFGAVGSASAGNHLFAPPVPVDICHNDQTLTVASTSLKGHLAHGDILGAC